MAEIKPLLKITRNVKLLALQRAERVLSHPEDYSAELYNETYLTVLKNAVPRSQELSGEDGEAIKIQLVTYADNQGAVQSETVSSPVTDGI